MGQPGTKVGELFKELGVTRQTLYRHVSPTGSHTLTGKGPRHRLMKTPFEIHAVSF